MTEAIAQPALAAGGGVPAARSGEIIDGFPARRGVIKHCYEGVLGDPRELHPAPFDIIFETPQRTPVDLQVRASVAALHAILREYRATIAYGQDL